MDVLKKIKGSSLMETLVATVLIIVIFMIASLTINNILSISIGKETSKINAHLNELHYNYLHDQIEIPYYEYFEDWDVSIERSKDEAGILYIDALYSKTNKSIEHQIRDFD